MTLRTTKTLRVSVLALAGLFLMLTLAFALLQTGPARRYLKDLLAEALSEPGVMELSAARLEGLIPFHFRVVNVEVADTRGVWLEAERLAFDLSPLEALAGRYRLSDAVAEGARLLRLPEDDVAGAEPMALPAWPADLALDDFRIPELRLAPEIAGVPLALTAEGRVQPDWGEGAEASLLVLATEGSDGFLQFAFAKPAAGGDLALALALYEPQGGLLARHLGLPGAPALALELKGRGGGESWQGTLSGGFADTAEIDAAIRLRRGETLALESEGRATLAALLDSRFAPLVAQGVAFSLAAEWQPDGRIRVDRARLDVPAANVELTGLVETAPLAFDAEIALASSDLRSLAALWDAELGGRLEARAHLSGPAAEPTLKLEAQLENATSGGYRARRVTATGDLAVAGEAIAFKARGRAEGLEPLPPALARLAGPGLDFEIAGATNRAADPVRIEGFSLANEHLALDGTGVLSGAAPDFEGRVGLRLADLREALPEHPLQGAATLEAELQADLATLSGRAALSGNFSDFASGIAALDALAGREPVLSATVSRDSEGTLAVTGFSLAGAGARIIGEGRADPGFARLALTARLSAGDLALLSAPLGTRLSGGAEVEARLAGAPNEFGGTFAFRFADLILAGEPVERLEGTLKADNLTGNPQGRIAAEGEARTLAFALSSAFALDPSALELADLELEAPGGRIEGALRIARESGLIEGDLGAAFDDLAGLSAALGYPIEGAAQASARLFAGDGGQAAELSLTGTNLKTVEARPAAGSARLTARARVTSPFARPEGRAEIRAEDVALGGGRMESLALDAEGTPESFAFDLAARGRGEPAGSLAASGTLAATAEDLRLEFAQFRGEYGGVSVSQRADLVAVVGPNAAALEGLDLAIGDGRVAGNIALNRSSVSGALDFERLPLDSLRTLDPELALESGTLSGRIALRGSRSAPEADADLRLAALRFATEEAAAPALDAVLNARWAEGRVRLRGSVAGLPATELALEAEAPLVLAADRLAMNVPRDGPVSLRLSGRGRIAPLAELVLRTEDRVDGRFEAALALDGTVAEPRLSGTAALSEGVYENFFAGTLLTGIEAELSGERRAIALKRLHAGDGDDGTIEAKGQATFGPDERLAFVLDAVLDGATLIRRDEATVKTSGRLRLEGDGDGARLSGALAVDEAEINIPDRFSTAPQTIAVTEINRPGAAPGPSAARRPAAAPAAKTTLDLAIEMPRRVFVRGHGLDSEWRGRLAVRGSAAEPVVEGAVSPIRGELSLLGRIFTLGEGSIRFQGASPPDPDLDLVASATAKDLVARIRATGRLSSPVIAFESDPAMPSDEILSRLLFGKSTGEISAVQAAHLAAAAATLSGKGPDFLSDIRQTLGVDRLTVTSDEEKGAAGAALSVGKYLTEDVFISVEQGLAQQSGRVNVEVELMPEVTVESEVGADAQSNVWLNWKLPY